MVYEVKLLHVCAYKVKEERKTLVEEPLLLRLLNYGLQLLFAIGFSSLHNRKLIVGVFLILAGTSAEDIE